MLILRHFLAQNFGSGLETFLKDFGPYWHDSITQFLQISRLHIYDANLLFHLIPKVLCCVEIWWLWRPFDYSELTVMFKKPVWDDLNFVTWCAGPDWLIGSTRRIPGGPVCFLFFWLRGPVMSLHWVEIWMMACLHSQQPKIFIQKTKI